jgi:flavin-dependent dehydrogenase
MKYDVIVSGASIGGCTAAILFARDGLRVALVEKLSDLAHYKILCGHSGTFTPTWPPPAVTMMTG